MFRPFKEALAEYRKGLKRPPRYLSQAGKQQVSALQGPRPKGACRFCAGPCPGRRRSWCSDECVVDYKIACNDPKAIENALIQRDKEVCQSCGLDLNRFIKEMMELPLSRVEMNLWRLEGFVTDEKLESFQPTLAGVSQLLSWIQGRRLWEAHHVVPVSKGGGLCPLEGFTTLCLRCHKAMHNRYFNYH